MSTLAKIVVTAIMSVLFVSCNFDIVFGEAIKGNGNVQTQERTLNKSFNSIKATEGLDVYITQGNTESVVVEADENLQDIILAEVRDNTLHLYTDANIKYSSAQKVLITFDDIKKITSTSGSDVFSTNTIKADRLELKSSSGSDMTLEVKAETIICSASSGSNLKVSGSTNKLVAESSSGSDIKAGELKASIVEARASSGADIRLSADKELTAKASSGGDITYYGDPEKINKTDGVSGSVRKN